MSHTNSDQANNHMKAYTDLEQSKKLAEILPVESADMCWTNHQYGWIRGTMRAVAMTVDEYQQMLKYYHETTSIDVFYPCWSLAALFDLLPYTLYDKATYNDSLYLYIDKIDDNEYRISYKWHGVDLIFTKWYNNLVDACYEMIIEINEN